MLMDLEPYHDIWSTLMMFAGLTVGFILGRRWHLLFSDQLQASPRSAKAEKR